MRKLLCLLSLALYAWVPAWSQSTGNLPYNPANYVPEGYWLGIESYIEHDGMVGSVDLTGYTTYRLYVHTLSELDFVSAIAGSENYEFILNSTSTPAWYNDADFGENLGSNINDALFSFFPNLEFDSWLTIGAEAEVPDFELMQVVGDINPFTAFNAGQNVLVDDVDGFAIYNLFPESGDMTTPAFAGSDMKVLVAQITTQGELSGQFYVQVFQDGAQDSEFRGVMPIYESSPFQSTGDGCTDALACNYNEDATEDDGSCTYAAAGYDCSGACLSDADGDGVCDENEVLGCTDVTACNYTGATEENGTCEYPISALVDCDGNCLNDADGDGVCDLLEVLGCTDELACNYDDQATDDDGTCSFAAAGFDCDGVPYTCENCFVSWTPSTDDYEVQCMDDLPADVDPAMAATNCFGDDLTVGGFYADASVEATHYNATTAYGAGEDGAFRIYGMESHPALAGLGLSSFWFENGGLELVEYNNGVAVLTGSIANENDANATFDVVLTFIEGQDANDWLNEDPTHSFVTNCPEDQVDILRVYELNPDHSYLTGTGNLAGSYLNLTHMPASMSKMYQIGTGANFHNCDFGFGGWFAWQGVMNGANVAGMAGDVVVDLEEIAQPQPAFACGGEHVDLYYSAFDASCNTYYTAVQTVTRNDTEAPVFSETPASATVECDSDLTAPVVTATDACDGAVAVTFAEEVAAGACPQAYTITRTWSAVDCSGNEAVHVQVLDVVDTTAPTIDVAAVDMTVECDGAGNEAALQDWLANLGGAVASDNCGNVTWSNDFTALTPVCGAAGSVEVTFMAMDECGNASTTVATFTIEDTTAPTMDTAAADATVECDGAGNDAELQAWLASNGGAAASDVCGGVTWTNDFAGFSDDCGATGAATVTFTATDDCGNATSTTATFTIEDTTVPSIDIAASSATVECDGAGNDVDLQAWLANQGGAAASDVCGGVTWSYSIDGSVAGCGGTAVTTVTFTATDDCGNASSTTSDFIIIDTTAPSMDTAAADATVECDGAGNDAELQAWLASNGGAAASDVCSGLTWSNDFAGLSDDCGATGSATVTFTATDDCGNATSTTATFTIEDTTAPSMDTPAADATVECDGAGNDAELQAWLASNGGAAASDACSGVTWTNDYDALSDGCGETGAATVTFTATDDCGNATSTTATFTIEDTTAPVVDEVATGVANGEFVEACATDVWGTIDIPAAANLVVTDACAGDVDVTFTEVTSGQYAPLEDGTSFCAASTPAAMPDGQTCDNFDPHAVRMFNLPGGEFFTMIDGLVTNHPDGTRTVEVTVAAVDNPNAGWTMQVDLNAELDWEGWIAQPGAQTFNSDCFDNHEEWYYHVVQNTSSAIGWGDYSGAVLSLTHQPGNEFYGWQFGMGANNHNANFGYWGWFYWEGTINGQFEAGSGSMHGDLDCTMPYDIERTYVSTDCAGNVNTFSYTVAVNGGGCQPLVPPFTGNPGIDVDWGDQETDSNGSISGGIDDPKDDRGPIKVLGLNPNPTDEHAYFQFVSEERLQVAVQLFDMTGTMQASLFEGTVQAGQRMQFEVNVSTLPAGLYQIRIASAVQIVNTKLMVMD